MPPRGRAHSRCAWRPRTLRRRTAPEIVRRDEQLLRRAVPRRPLQRFRLRRARHRGRCSRRGHRVTRGPRGRSVTRNSSSAPIFTSIPKRTLRASPDASSRLTDWCPVLLLISHVSASAAYVKYESSFCVRETHPQPIGSCSIPETAMAPAMQTRADPTTQTSQHPQQSSAPSSPTPTPSTDDRSAGHASTSHHARPSRYRSRVVVRRAR